MKANRIITGIVVMAFAATVLPAQSMAIEFSERELARLHAGKTVKKTLAENGKGGLFGGTGWAIVDAPVDVVWKALIDFNSYPDFFPRTVSAKEINKRNNRSLVQIQLGYKILRVDYTIDVLRNEQKKTISFNLARNRPNDLDETRGYWRLFPQPDGRTLVAYAVAVKVPLGITAFLGESTEKKLGRYLIGLPGHLKDWVEGPKGNRYRQITARN